MTDKRQRARELLVAEYERGGLCKIADALRSGFLGQDSTHGFALRAIAAALPDEQPAQGELRDKLAQSMSYLEGMQEGDWSNPDSAHACDAYRRLADVAIRLLAPPAGPAVEATRYRHKVRGTIYTEVCSAELQAATGDVEESAILTIYRGEDGKVWARRAREFGDGRFERLIPPPTTSTGERG